MRRALRGLRAVVRSLRIYYGRDADRSGMDALYGRFVTRGDLVFDIGSHVGDRIAAFRRLGARVVAAEPQPALVKTLRLLYGRDRDVTIVGSAVGSREGSLTLRINTDNPTVSTASTDFMRAADGAPGWEGQVWDREIEVPVTTLDALIARHGTPAFVKIDVEGFEAEVLGGLSKPPPALSFEFTTIQKDVARSCLARCRALGYVRYNGALGETKALIGWRDADAIAQWLEGLRPEDNSGDIYATF